MSDKFGKDPSQRFDNVLQVISGNIHANKNAKSDEIEKGILVSLHVRIYI